MATPHAGATQGAAADARAREAELGGRGRLRVLGDHVRDGGQLHALLHVHAHHAQQLEHVLPLRALEAGERGLHAARARQRRRARRPVQLPRAPRNASVPGCMSSKRRHSVCRRLAPEQTPLLCAQLQRRLVHAQQVLQGRTEPHRVTQRQQLLRSAALPDPEVGDRVLAARGCPAHAWLLGVPRHHMRAGVRIGLGLQKHTVSTRSTCAAAGSAERCSNSS